MRTPPNPLDPRLKELAFMRIYEFLKPNASLSHPDNYEGLFQELTIEDYEYEELASCVFIACLNMIIYYDPVTFVTFVTFAS